MKPHKITITKNYYSLVIICLALIFPAVNNFAKSLADIISITPQFFSLFVYAIYIGIYLFTTFKSGLYQLIAVIGTIASFSIILVGNYILFPHTQLLYTESFLHLRQVLIIYLPAMAVAMNISEWDQFLAIFYKFAWVGTFSAYSSMLLSPIINYMEFAVSLLPMSIYFLLIAVYSKKTKNSIMFLITSFSILFAGNRISMLSVMLYVIGLFMINGFNYKKISNWFLVILISLLSLLIIFYWKELLMVLNYVLNSLGISSRTIDLLIRGEATSLGIRKSIYGLALEQIKVLNYKPNGIFSDRYYLRLVRPDFIYVHNIFLDFIYSFGIIATSIFFIWLIYKTIKILFKGDKMTKNMFWFIFCIIAPRLVYSGSFITEGFFFILLGFMINNKHFKKTTIYEKQLRERGELGYD